jgi:hypothetical protein
MLLRPVSPPQLTGPVDVWSSPNASLLASPANLATSLAGSYLVIRPWVLTEGRLYTFRAALLNTQGQVGAPDAPRNIPNPHIDPEDPQANGAR